MKEDTITITKAGAKEAIKGSVYASAASIVTGVAMTTAPQTILWGLVTVGASTVIAPAVVATFAVGGAVAGGAAGAALAYRKIKKINKEFDKLKNGD